MHTNARHFPDNPSDLEYHMRNPEFGIGTSTTVTIYSGVEEYNNSYGTATCLIGPVSNASRRYRVNVVP